MKTDTPIEADTIRDYVRARYGAIANEAGGECGCGPECCHAETAAPAKRAGCCDPGCCGADPSSELPYGEQLGYSAAELSAVPAGADLGLGCGNPLAIASIRPGETVVDLGSGAGFDCLLAARQLAGTGQVIGVDMTPEMLVRARANAAKAGLPRVEFRLGEIEALPLADASADLVISNCAINLSPEKQRVFHEAFRVLKPGGRLALTDIVATKPLPATLREKLSAIGACIAGAALVDDLHAWLAAAGFREIEVRPRESSRALIDGWTEQENAGEFVVSATIAAVKPKA